MTPEANDSVSVEFEVPGSLRPRFRHRPGQYLTLSRDFPGGNARRTYSIHEPAGGPCSVLVKRVSGGLFSSYANDELRAGDTLDVLEPAGTFGRDIYPSRASHVLACAAGSGITPVLPILETVLEGNPDSSATLIYCNRTSSSVIFRERLGDLKDRHMDRLDVAHVLSQEGLDVPLMSGRVDARRAALLLGAFAPDDPAGVTCLLCGPEGLMDTMEKAMLKHGFEAGRIHRERFDAPKVKGPKRRRAKAAGTCRVSVVLNGSIVEIEAAKGVTLLESIGGQGLEVPFSCTGGVCSTCRARLREGTVEMDVNYALDDREVADGMILACQARPTAERIVVDFDSLWG